MSSIPLEQAAFEQLVGEFRRVGRDALTIVGADRAVLREHMLTLSETLAGTAASARAILGRQNGNIKLDHATAVEMVRHDVPGQLRENAVRGMEVVRIHENIVRELAAMGEILERADERLGIKLERQASEWAELVAELRALAEDHDDTADAIEAMAECPQLLTSVEVRARLGL